MRKEKNETPKTGGQKYFDLPSEENLRRLNQKTKSAP